MPRWIYKGKMISGSHSRASEISYNGNKSGLDSGNVQDAIDEHVLKTDSKIGDIRSLTTISKGSLVEAVNEQSERLNENKAICSDEYDPKKPYVVGKYCIHDNKMQKCKTATAGTPEVPEEFDQTKWDVVSIAGELSEQNENFGGLTFSQDADGNWGYKVGGADPVIPFKQKQSIEVRVNYYIPQDSGGYHLSYSIPEGKDGYMVFWQDYVSTKSESICSVSGAKLISNKDGIYNMQYDRQAMQIYSFTGGTTIKISRGGYSSPSGVYVIIIY